MSGEFGDSGGGFFHAKINNALEDAQGGTSNGAKLMAAILEPLSKLARAVSWEEASDSGEDSTVQVFFDQLPNLRRAVSAMEGFVEPARRLAVRELAKLLKQSAVVESIGKDEWHVKVRRDLIPEHCEWDLLKDAITHVAVPGGAYWSGSSWSSGGNLVTHHVCRWNAKRRIEWLSKENERLKQELAAAIAGVKEQS